MTQQYRVECEGQVREVYVIDADSPEDAMARWAEGHLQVQESHSVEPVRADLDEDPVVQRLEAIGREAIAGYTSEHGCGELGCGARANGTCAKGTDCPVGV